MSSLSSLYETSIYSIASYFESLEMLSDLTYYRTLSITIHCTTSILSLLLLFSNDHCKTSLMRRIMSLRSAIENDLEKQFLLSQLSSLMHDLTMLLQEIKEKKNLQIEKAILEIRYNLQILLSMFHEFLLLYNCLSNLVASNVLQVDLLLLR